MARRPLSHAVVLALVWPLVLPVALPVVLPLLVACDPSAGSVERDPSAKQILSFREDNTSIARYAADETSLFLQTTVGTSSSGNMKVYDFSRADLSSKVRTPVASGVLSFYEDGSTVDPPASVSVAEMTDSSGGSTVGYVATVTYPDGRPPVQVDRLASPTCCDWLVSPWGIRRYNRDFVHTSFWIGPFDALAPLASSFQVSNWRRDARANAFLLSGTNDALPSQTFGIWSVVLDGSAPMPMQVLGPPLGPVVAVDPSEDISKIASLSLSDGTVDLEECWSPGEWSTGLNFGIEGTRCYAVYQRLVGRTPRLFLHDYGESNERLLPGPTPTNVAVTSWNARWLTWWSQTVPENGTYSLFIYDLATATIQRCETGMPGSILWQTQMPGAVVVTGPASASEMRTWDLVSPTCPVAAMAEQPALVLAPDGNRWAWLETNANTGSKITMAARDLSNPRVIAAGTYFQQMGFLDNQRMLIWRTALDGFGYSWIDTTLTTPVEHALAEQVFFISSRLDAHQILIGHRFSAQDQAGDLSLIDMDTGAERLLSHGVADATFRIEGGQDRVLDVAFVVHGRFASAQDGLWLSKIPLPDP